MELLLLLTLVSANLPFSACSRGQSDQYNNSIAEFNRHIPISPVQAYRMKLKAVTHSEPVRHAVHPFSITSIVSDSENDHHALTPTPRPVNDINQAIDRLRARPKSFDGESNFVSLVQDPAPVYKDARLPHTPITSSNYSSNNFQAGAQQRFSSNMPGIGIQEGSSANGPAYDIDLTSATNEVLTDSDSLESKIVEFRNCLTRDLDRVSNRSVRKGNKFVPRDEIESTCRIFIEKMDQMREECMQALEAVVAAKTKSPAEISDSKKSWWRFLTFGR